MDAVPAANTQPKPAVVFVHGLWMNGWDLLLLARRVKRCGFRVYRFRYASILHGPRDNAFLLNRFVETIPEDTVHFVGHSLGGLLIRRLFLDYPRQRPGRVVTLGTPHGSSRTAMRLFGTRWGRWTLGRSLPALTTPLPPWDARRELGSIAGSRPVGVGRLIGSLPEPNDGTIAVEETRVPGCPHIVLPVFHMGMAFSPDSAREVCLFLRDGRFSNGSQTAPKSAGPA
jgi:pimeloyl-ACP methyl ester carboxylesterase